MERGFATIGYNWVITADGSVYMGREIHFVPAAAFGRNFESVNVALTGNFQEGDPGYTGPPTAQQVQSLKELALAVHADLTHIVRTIGHRDVATMFYPEHSADYSTVCPGNQLYSIIPAVKEYVRGRLHNNI
jgi:hypothetical protein